MEEGYDINENKTKNVNLERQIIINENTTAITPFSNINSSNKQIPNNIYFNTFQFNKKGNKLLKQKGKYFLIRKRKRKQGDNGKHTKAKASYDNISRKIKSWIISDLIKFINKKFGEKNIKKKLQIKLYIINNTQAYNTTINYNINLLEKKACDILSENVSQKVKIKYDHNKKIIEKILVNKKFDNIIEILNLNFLDCMDHYIGKKTIDLLRGFEAGYKERKKSITDYGKRFESFVNNYEQYYSDKNFRILMNRKK